MRGGRSSRSRFETVRRYEQASTVLTSNKGFEDWGQVLGDDVMAAALIDRLVHHCHIFNIRSNSFRMRHHTELSKALLAELEAEKPSPSRRRRRTKEATTNRGSSPQRLRWDSFSRHK